MARNGLVANIALAYRGSASMAYRLAVATWYQHWLVNTRLVRVVFEAARTLDFGPFHHELHAMLLLVLQGYSLLVINVKGRE